jgi:hypothetical protein
VFSGKTDTSFLVLMYFVVPEVRVSIYKGDSDTERQDDYSPYFGRAESPKNPIQK